jgi:26S proteasome regulatory subunit N10
MRNGDYSPTRFAAMIEAVNEIANAKINGNAETTVGLLSMAGRIEVHLSPCRNLGPIMTALQKEVKIGGESNFVGALKTAQLALKNRPNKSQKQRVVMFAGSPVLDDIKEMTKLGKQFKKNNVAVDIINFGTENGAGQKTENPEKLEALVQAANNSDNSHLVHIPPGPHIFSDLVLTSAIMVGGGVVGTSANAGAPGLSLGGQPIDPNMEPELAMALRISQEEERQRQEKFIKDSRQDAKAGNNNQQQGTGGQAVMDESGDDEQAMLAAAIAMSMAAEGGAPPANKPANSTTSNQSSSSNTAANTSNNNNNKPAPKAESGATPMDTDIADALKDPNFINSLLQEQGMGEVSVEDILASMNDDKDDKAKPKKEEPKKDGKK